MASLKSLNARLSGMQQEAGEHLSGLRQILERVTELQEEQQESFDNIPESLQASEKGEICGARADRLLELAEELESAISEIESLDWVVA